MIDQVHGENDQHVAPTGDNGDVTRKPLSQTHPEIAAEADGWDPSVITAGSKKLVTWRCRSGHCWSARVQDRSKAGCPFCSGRRALPGVTDLATRNPKLAAEADGWDPTTVTVGSSKRVGWKCKSGHRWVTSPKRRSQGDGCPYCSGRYPIVGETDLRTLNPDLALQADGWDPRTVTLKSGAVRSWKCSRGHRWRARVADRSNGNGCPGCSSRIVVPGETDFASRHPDLIVEVLGWDPRSVHAGSEEPRDWRCRFGHTWTTAPKNRSKGSGCPVCSGNKIQVGFNDLATVDPALSQQILNGDPTSVSKGSGTKLRWQCELGHDWIASVASRVQGQGCPVCSGKRVLIGFNDLQSKFPEIALQAHGWDPQSVTAKSGQVKWWICEKGHQWRTKVATRSNGIGCPICSNHQLLVGFNDLQATHPEIAAEADGWDPKSVVAGTEKKKRWKCAHGHVWIATVKSRAFQDTGCPSCATYGFNPSEDGWLYLVRDESRDLLQIGKTNVPKQRLKSHERNGFSVVLDLRGPMDGVLTSELEKRCIQALKRLGAMFLTDLPTYQKFDGYTETWFEESLQVSKIAQIVEWTYSN